MESSSEIERIKEHYQRRKAVRVSTRYEFTDPSVLMSVQELERALVRWIRSCSISPLNDKHVLEIGCGVGNNLLELLRLGFNPANLVGNELMPDRVAVARSRLPADLNLIEGDARHLQFANGSFDVVLQATVFSSILDDAFQVQLATHMWSLVRPGGGILWYDFVYDNPQNANVKGMAVNQVRRLFPNGKLTYWRLTLAPPISRLITHVHPSLYTIFNALRPLRTHVLCWIRKG